jgi:hypothetical protein
MKLLFIFLFFCTVHGPCVAQKCYSLDQGWIPCSMSDTLIDKSTGNYYVVVRSERCIKAFDRYQRPLWETNPWKSKELSRMHGSNWNGYLNPDSIYIRTIDFPKTEYMGGNRSIVVYFTDRIDGFLDKKTGRFSTLGEN